MQPLMRLPIIIMVWIVLMSKYSKILLAVLVLLLVSIKLQARIYVVSVGVADYPGAKYDLRLPGNDAATMEWLYKENKQAVVKLLRNGNATVSNIQSVMRNLYAKAAPDDIVVLYFSGHGVKGAFCCYDGLLTYSDIVGIMSAGHCRNMMVFADACYSGAMRKKYDVGRKQTTSGNNVMFFLACRSNEFSIEKSTMTNGLFTHALQHGLRGAADKNRNRVITAKELYQYVSTKVKQTSGNRQHPVMWGRFSDAMPVMKW